jgi:ABC-type nitrate/sulfonate/bicarbonate transport system substrate-binding protein
MAGAWRRGLGSGAILLLVAALACAPPPAKPAAPATSGASAPAPAAGTAPQAAAPAVAAPTPWAGALTKLKLSFPGTSVGALHLFVPEAEGIYQRYGLDVEAIQMAPNVSVTALHTGEVPYSAALGSMLRGALKSMPMKGIMAANDSPYISLVTQPEIRTMADLRGRTIGTANRGNTNDVVVRLMLKQHRLEPDRDVNLLNVGETAAAYQAMRQGLIDGSPLSPPWVQEGQKLGWNVLLSGSAIDMPMSGVATSHSKLERERDEVVRLMMAQLETQRFIRENREGVIEVIMKRLEMDRETAAAAYDSVRELYGPGDLKRSGLTTFLEVEAELGNIDTIPPLEVIADFTVVPEARRRLGW